MAVATIFMGFRRSLPYNPDRFPNLTVLAMRFIPLCRSLLALFLIWPVFAEAGQAGGEIRVGVLAYRGAERADSDWTATFEHLNRVLPGRQIEMVAEDIDALNKDAAAGKLDFVITNPGHYIELETELGASRIATVESQNGPPPAAAIGATVFVKAERSDLRDLGDLKGKTIAAVAPETFSFRLTRRELQERSIDLFAKPTHLNFLGFPADKVTQAVRSGQADAGVVRACLIEAMAAEGLVKPGEFRVLSAQTMPSPGCRISTRLYPDWPFAKLAHTPEPLAKQVAQALLSMPAGENGQSWTVPVDYQSVHDLYRALKLGPYQALGPRGLTEMLWEYRHWLILAGLAFLWWVAHVLRVQVLVRRRTEQLRSANEAARLRQEELEHAVRLSLVGEMASGLAHEINQPLAAIANYAKGSLRRLEAQGEPEQIAHGLRQIANQAERGGEIVRRMRDFVRKRPGKMAVTEMGLVVSEALALFEPVARRRQLSLQYTPPVTPLRLIADPIQLEEVVLNLLQNAADAVEGGERQEIMLYLEQTNTSLCLSVADSGPGISADDADKLFQPFFTTKPQGLGLGLSLCRSIVEDHGGRLQAENRPGGGAVFHVRLPLAGADTDV